MVTRTGERVIGAVFGRVGMYASYGDDEYLLLFNLGGLHHASRVDSVSVVTASRMKLCLHYAG